jgi:hypothetical protein
MMMLYAIKRQFFSMSRIFNEKCSKPKIFFAFLLKLLRMKEGGQTGSDCAPCENVHIKSSHGMIVLSHWKCCN